MKKIMLILLFLLLLTTILSCDMGLEVVNITLGDFPRNIVYYINDSDYFTLYGTTFITEIRDGRVFEDDIYSSSARRLTITNNIDFTTPGVYEVTIRWALNDYLVGRIPIQIIERDMERRTEG
ncbi:MAG: hypothetical protein FWC20_12430 [Oscillospiraceae bacterium]|nr:hypothetical protein [Oscillospiraceae bacterium]MCL2280192.1 hypothetical protein [Oscillospiraceae bacterium]